MSALSLCVLGLHLFLYLSEEIPWRMDEDAALQEEHCGTCHSADYPRNYAKSPDGWRKTVEMMLVQTEEGQAPASPKVKGRITRLLQRHRSADGETLFRLRCGRCHGLRVLLPYLSMERAALSLLLKNHASQYNYAIQVWERRLIEPVLLSRTDPPAGQKAREAAAQLGYERACGNCHTVRFRYRTMCAAVPAKDWEAVILRMQRKAPLLIRAEDLANLTARARSICRSPGVPIPPT